MKLHDICRLLELLGAENIDISKPWVRCSCPLAKILHKSGKDDRPSFGVVENLEGESGFQCFTCGGGSLYDLAHSLYWNNSLPSEAAEFYLAEEIQKNSYIDKPKGQLGPDKFRSTSVGRDLPIPVPNNVINTYPKAQNDGKFEGIRTMDWFNNRGISFDSIYKFQLRYDPVRRMIVFPVLDRDGITYLLRARSRVEKIIYSMTGQTTGFPEETWGRKDFWFGMQFYDPTRPVLLVESETDVLRLDTLGVTNALASCGPVTQLKMSRIISDHIILGFDSDVVGLKYSKKALSMIDSGRVVSAFYWSNVKVKDAGELKSRADFDIVQRSRNTIVKGGAAAIYGNEIEYKDKFKNLNTPSTI